MYLAIIETIVSAVICSLRNEKMSPVCYVIHVLAGVET